MVELETVIPDVAKVIELRFGLKSQAIGYNTWRRAIRKRMEAVKIDMPATYVQRLVRARGELQALVELLVVPETWFFRDRAALDQLAVYARNQEERGRTKPWHILSLACATGEEAYSIAMVLHDIGIPLNRFSVEGVDISKTALDIARKGSYGANSFRTNLTLMHRRNFDKIESGYEVHESIRNRVKFIQENIASPQFGIGRKKYDAIFCRNLLIYFTSHIQQQVFDSCNRLLDEGCLLILGPTESELARLAGFEPFGPRNACAFSKRMRHPIDKPSWRETAAMNRIHHAVEVVQKHTPQEGSLSPTDSVDRRSEWLAQAMKLADEGQIEASISICQKYIERFEASADIYFLLGALQLAERNDDAALTYLQKAIYLAPKHYDSLVNLALIAERKGERDQAELYWRRARKQAEAGAVKTDTLRGVTVPDMQELS